MEFRIRVERNGNVKEKRCVERKSIQYTVQYNPPPHFVSLKYYQFITGVNNSSANIYIYIYAYTHTDSHTLTHAPSLSLSPSHPHTH